MKFLNDQKEIEDSVSEFDIAFTLSVC